MKVEGNGNSVQTEGFCKYCKKWCTLVFSTNYDDVKICEDCQQMEINQYEETLERGGK